MIERLRVKLVIILACVLIIWPVAHMTLSLFGGLNSWKLGGWGMYASIPPEDTYINVFLIGANSGPLEEMKVSSLIKPNRPSLYVNGKTVILDGRAFTGEIKSVDFASYTRDIVVFRRGSAIKAMVEQIQKHLLDPVAISHTLVFISHLRLSVSRRMAYTESEVYLIRDGCLEKLGVYSSDQHEINDILNLIGDQVDRECNKTPKGGITAGS
jgi:hypothetical protein